MAALRLRVPFFVFGGIFEKIPPITPYIGIMNILFNLLHKLFASLLTVSFK